MRSLSRYAALISVLLSCQHSKQKENADPLSVLSAARQPDKLLPKKAAVMGESSSAVPSGKKVGNGNVFLLSKHLLIACRFWAVHER